MEPTDYSDLSELALLELCVWREARGEPLNGKRGVAHVVRNRANSTTHWWGTDWVSVITHPWQFSSFNAHDPNSERWPVDTDPSFVDCCQAATAVYMGSDYDLTKGATFYHDTGMGWPHSWGNEEDYENTLNVGRLRFYKLKPAQPAAAELNLGGDV